MDPFHFQCPHCRGHLKTRDRLSVGRQVTCPECRKPFEIVEQRGELVAQKLAPDPATAGAPAAPASRRPSRALVAGVCLLAVLFLAVAGLTARQVWRSRSAPPTIPQHVVAVNPAPQPAVDKAKPPPAPERKLSEPEQRLLAIGRVLSAGLEQDKTFPPGSQSETGLPIDRRFSWLAGLLDRFDAAPNVPFVRDRGWQDPLNDAFVRRRIAAFQNPAVEKLTGDDGYPGSHFAGISGVGADSAALPVDEPRAGIFGYDRKTRAEDVRDGLGNTMLVAGVEDRLGSWAAATATVRGFTQEPYLRGPDGFGTGQPDRMFVLMADGRVMSLGAKTDPGIVRKMAAMSDESHRRPTPDAVPQVALNGPDDQPIEPLHADDAAIPVELAPPPPVKTVAEIETALQQEIAAYTFPPKTATRLVVLREVAELTGVPLETESPELGPARQRLDAPLGEVKVPMLKDTTVRSILVALLDPVDLTFKVEPGKLRLVRK